MERHKPLTVGGSNAPCNVFHTEKEEEEAEPLFVTDLFLKRTIMAALWRRAVQLSFRFLNFVICYYPKQSSSQGRIIVTHHGDIVFIK